MMGYLAYLAKVVVDYAPFSYGVVSLASFFLICLSLWLWGGFWSRFQIAKFEERRSASVSVNPLDKSFERNRIHIQDFYHPFFRKVERARFSECEFFGPGIVFLDGGNLSTCKFNECECVIVNVGTKTTTTTTMFSACTFENCQFYRILFLMPKDQLAVIRKAATQGSSFNVLAGSDEANG